MSFQSCRHPHGTNNTIMPEPDNKVNTRKSERDNAARASANHHPPTPRQTPPADGRHPPTGCHPGAAIPTGDTRRGAPPPYVPPYVPPNTPPKKPAPNY